MLGKRGRSLASQFETRDFERTFEEVLTQSTVQTELVFQGKEVPVIWAKTGNRTREACEFIAKAVKAGISFEVAWKDWEAIA